MDHPRYLRFFSTGDILTLAAAVISVAVAWGSMTAQMRELSHDNQELREEIAALRAMRITPEADARIRVLERRADDSDSFKAEMRGDLREVNRKLDVLLEKIGRDR